MLIWTQISRQDVVFAWLSLFERTQMQFPSTPMLPRVSTSALFEGECREERLLSYLCETKSKPLTLRTTSLL